MRENSVYYLMRPGLIERCRDTLGAVGDDFVEVRYLYSGICGSDVAKFRGDSPVTFPFSIGHEFVAVVEAMGANVDGMSVGLAITSDFNYRCEMCDHCEEGRTHLCREGQVARFTNRAFSQRAQINQRYLVPIGETPDIKFVLSEPLSCALHALAWAKPQPNDRILVVGAGGIGLCVCFALVNQYRTPFDVTDLIDGRLKALEPLVSPLGRVTSNLAEEYDVVLDVSGTASGLESACRRVRAGGKVCSMSHLDPFMGTTFLLEMLTRRDISFKMSYLNGQRSNLTDAISLLDVYWTPKWLRTLTVHPIEEIHAEFRGRQFSPYCKSVISAPED